jgi:hypothetical protein
LVQAETLVGSHVQPRYVLPLITMLLAATLAPSADNDSRFQGGPSLSRLQLWLIAAGLSAAQAISLFVNLRRYVTTGSYNLDGATDWWWSAGPSPFTVLAIGALSFTTLMVIFVLTSVRAESRQKV